MIATMEVEDGVPRCWTSIHDEDAQEVGSLETLNIVSLHSK